MTALRPPSRSPMVHRASLALVLLLAACGSPSVDAPLSPAGDALSAKAPAPASLAVTSTSPRYTDRGTTADVRIFGSGFVAGAQATWLLRGVADPARVRTNSTTFVSSTEVVANITVSGDADLAFWDVQVSAAGKNGVGTEIHEISTAEYLGPATFVNAMNDLGQIVGIDASAAGAFVYDDAFGMRTLGPGQGWGIDPLGTMVLGRDGASFATAWVRQDGTSTYTAEQLPKAVNSVGGNATSAARDAAGTLLVAGWQIFPGTRKGTTVNRPALWRHDAVWSAPTLLALPSGSTSAAGRDINGKGQIVGRIDASDRGAVWDDPATVTALDGLPSGINPAGTIVVGSRGGVPVYWYRTSSGAWNATGVALPSLGGSCSSEARGVNDAGVIVGKSCDGNSSVSGAVWRLDLSGPTPAYISGPKRLPGLGGKGNATETSAAAKITSTSPYIIAGTGSTPAGAAVRWRAW